MAIPKTVIARRQQQPEIAILAAQTGSTYMSESIIDIINISTTNPRFSTTASSEKLSLGNFSNDRQPEMPPETENTYISGNMADSNEIPTTNLTCSIMASSIKVSRLSPSALRQRPATENGMDGKTSAPNCHFRLSVTVAVTCEHFC